MLHTFRSYPASSVATFKCPGCGKEKRTRTFKAECTCNPFNKRPDGQMRTPAEVRDQSQDEAEKDRRQFLSEPLCLKCEDALASKERWALWDRRRQSTLQTT